MPALTTSRPLKDESPSSESPRAAVDGLMARVYDELRALASRYLRHEAPLHILQTTAQS